MRWQHRPEGSNWGDFGPDDELGRLNLLTPEKVLQGVAEVREGRSFCLSLPLDYPGGNALNRLRHPPRRFTAGRADKLNYKGIGEVMGVMLAVITAVDSQVKLEFRETKKEESRSVPAFSVTLGVMPDYLYEDGGLRIDGVTPEKPAAAAGLQKGDIITEIGAFVIADIYAYMNALSAFKKGDKVKVVYMREGKKRETEVAF